MMRKIETEVHLPISFSFDPVAGAGAGVLSPCNNLDAELGLFADAGGPPGAFPGTSSSVTKMARANPSAVSGNGGTPS